LSFGELRVGLGDCFLGEIVGSARFTGVEGKSDERQDFDKKLGVSKISFKAFPQIVKILACLCGACTFIALGLVHIHFLAPNRDVWPLWGSLVPGVSLLAIGFSFVFALYDSLTVLSSN
jgi:hypothetical protein